jgi:hypothetical protein
MNEHMNILVSSRSATRGFLFSCSIIQSQKTHTGSVVGDCDLTQSFYYSLRDRNHHPQHKQHHHRSSNNRAYQDLQLQQQQSHR